MYTNAFLYLDYKLLFESGIFYEKEDQWLISTFKYFMF